MITQKRIKSATFLALILMVFAIVLSASVVSAVTAKIGNARMVLYPEFENGKAVVERSIRVINDNNVSVNITLHPSEDFEGVLEILDNDFVLEPGEEKDARFVLTLTEEKDYDGRINVLFKEVGEKNGVALSSRIIVRSDGGSDGGNEEDDGGASIGDKIKKLFLGDGGEDGEEENSEAGENEGFGKTGVFLASTLLLLIIALAGLFYVQNKKRMEKKRAAAKRDDKKRGKNKNAETKE